jgi:hypothetical protein
MLGTQDTERGKTKQNSQRCCTYIESLGESIMAIILLRSVGTYRLHCMVSVNVYG